MAKKYDHEKQSRPADKNKTERPASDRRPRVVGNSPNPDLNRSFPKASKFKKQPKSDNDERSGRFESRERDGDRTGRPASNDNKRPFVKKDGDKRWDSTRGFNAGDKRPFVKRDGERSDNFRDGGDKRPFVKRDGERSDNFRDGGDKRPFVKRDGERSDSFRDSGDKRPFVKRDGDKRPFSAGSRTQSRPRPDGDGDRPFDRNADFKKRTDSNESRPDFRKKDNRRDDGVRENQAKAGRKPEYNTDRMKEKLPPKVRTKVEKKESTHTDGTIRLNRFIANAGVCSRREADELIAAGDVVVNGEVITELGSRVSPTDHVTFKGKHLTRENFAYVLLNKPKDYITTTDDPEERKTVMDIVADACEERIYPIGRLDRKTTGLLLLTNDGKLAEKLSHPSNNIVKIYQAELNRPISEEDFEMITKGFELEDGFIKADELAIITPDAEVVGIQIHSGKNRIVRRIFEHLGYKVQKLDRTVYAGLTKKELPRGTWRHLTEKEVIRLKYLS